jgi:Mlc titration factor MtfA (ptsG expression regulator)
MEWFCAMLLSVGGAAAWLRWARRRREQQLRQQPFPAEWESDLSRHLRLYRRLPESLRHQLRGLVRVFLHTKRFEGAAGLAVTESMRVRIAAQACILLLHRETRVYPRLRSIIVYPSSFTVPTHVEFTPGHHLAETEDRLGESWRTGAVVLSWQTIEEESRQPAGRNLVLHEFAHQLDMENGAADGMPALDSPREYADWARVLDVSYQAFRRDVNAGRFSPLPPYAAENKAEFFAVATELFFEAPSALRSQFPSFYEKLCAFYRQNPELYDDSR